ncbi:GlsB/YeaQ/YmgE family stress response membrane protein [Pseudactinotalea suaedae]|jgi:uncharacterized membrane protein YeaQ/YmgE (transglycosylase-associated protein family)|uniref:GlsB/YeaQ/YmgE family stress response membrane protein n=1 Tax=Pseudactinotalea suaedae TaxID=1524924 RepID=UPI0012E24DB1|nr:GlsB/YeaQ/YmgE family stress response membrane protein [Pseudactinotalea suaedae]
MEFTVGGIIGTIIFGAVIGILARLVKPGPQRVSIVATVIIGIIGAVVGYFLAGLLGVESTGGIDWIRWLISIVVAVIVLGIYIGMSGGKGRGGTAR